MSAKMLVYKAMIESTMYEYMMYEYGAKSWVLKEGEK